MKFTILLLRTVSVISLIYFLLIIWVSGIKTSFLSFWLALSIGCLGMSFLLALLYRKEGSPYGMAGYLLVGMIWFGFTVFLIVESMIITESMKSPKTQADYVIVLGAQVRGTIPSKTLNMRIQTAASYLKENPDSLVICSGGQGEGEQITEALAIKKGLLAHGINEKRILLEETSTNTVQNLINSKKLILDPDSLVVVVTSDFHIFRAKKLAEHLGYENLSMCPADEFMVTTISYYVREFLAIFKDLLAGNLR
jgi:uncharacterized SAM-binding protein YcdF (DUF218 family)